VIHLYIANNYDWINLWIERFKRSNNGSLTWEVVSFLKEVERRRDTNLTQREIDLAHGLKDK